MGSQEQIVKESRADRIRRMAGLERTQIEAYVPEQMVRKIGRGWSYWTVNGNDGQAFCPTKRAAVGAAKAHHEMKLLQLAEPEEWFDLVRLVATERLRIMDELMARGYPEMEAGRIADERIPDA